MAGFIPRNGMRVEVTGKGLVGTVSYIGMTAFAAGKWIGVALDESKGKNDGTVQGKKYFECPPNHGIFVRQTQLTELVNDPKVQEAIKTPNSVIIPPSSGASRISGLKKSGVGSGKILSPSGSMIKSALPSKPASGILGKLPNSNEPASEASKNKSPSSLPSRSSPSGIPGKPPSPKNQTDPSATNQPSAIKPPSPISQGKQTSGLRQPTSSSPVPPRMSPTKATSSEKPPAATPSKGIRPPSGTGIRPPSGASKNEPPSESPSPRGIPRPGALTPPQSGLAKPKSGISRGIPGSTSSPASALQKPQSGISKPSSSTPKVGLQKPASSGLQKPSAGLKPPSSTVKTETKVETDSKKEAPTKVPSKEPPPPQPDFEEPSPDLEEPVPIDKEVATTPETAETSAPAPLPPAHKVVAASEEVLELQRKLMEKDKMVIDLEEKLNVLKQKRIADLAKVKEVDKLKLLNEQHIEYKTKWQESMRELQNQLRQAQNDAREVADKMNDESDITELHEAVEMATLDKEMAEEKHESLSQEHEQLKERYEEVSLELEILKNEISEGGVETVQATAQTKHLEEQNNRLKEALLKLKDIAQNDKAQLANVIKLNKELSQNISSVGAERDKLKERLHEALEQVDDLKEQVDMALGAEEMVEKLTDKNLDLEEKIEQLEEVVQDLEALRELNIELEESHVQTEHDLREELDMADNKIRELERQIVVNIEQANDYQETIRKFRDLVQQLQGRIKELHEQSSDSIKVDDLDTTPVPEIDVKTKIAETKQHGRVIELELNKYYVKEADKKIAMVNTFLPEHFSKRGADFDGILLILLMERMQFKCQLLSNQLHEKHNVSELVEAGQPVEGMNGDQASYGCLLAYHLTNLQLVVSQFLRGLNECDVHTFVRVSGQYPEIAAHEKILDNYIELLRKDLLDDTVSVEVLEKTVNQYKNFYKLNLASAERDCTDFLSDSLIMFQHGAAAVAIDILRLKGLAKGCDEGSIFLNLLNTMELKNIEIKQLCRKIKRRMIQDSNTTLSYPVSVTQDLLDSMEEQSILARYVQDLASVLSLKANQLSEDELLLSGHLEEASQDCITMIYEKDEDPLEVLSASFKKVLLCLSGIAIKLPEGEYDTEPAQKPTPPYLERAETFKEELSSTTRLEMKIDQKQNEITEVKKSLKAKGDELSEANIRISLLEKRADNATKGATSKVEQMTKKLETVQQEFYDKSRQNEKTMDALQSDIDMLENEKTDLKKKLEIYAKKSKLDFGALSQTSAAMASIVSPGKPGSAMASLSKAGVAGAPPVQVVLKDSPVFLAQLDAQKKALKTLQRQNWSLKCEKMKNDLALIPKPYMPKLLWRDGKFVPNPLLKEDGAEKGVEENRLNSQTVMKECNTLMTNLNNLVVFPKVIDITRGMKDGKYKPPPHDQLTSQLNVLNTVIKEKDELSKKVESVITKELPGSSIKTNLRTFLSPEYARLRKENESPIHIATLRVPTQDAQVKAGVRKVAITPQEFSHIHELLAKS